MSDPRTAVEALRWAAWNAFGAAAFSLRCHDSAYAEDRVSDEEKYAAECVTEQRIGYTLLVEAGRLAALPAVELSEERGKRLLDFVTSQDISRLRAAGFTIVETPPLTGERISRLWTDGDQMFQRLYYGQAKEEK